MRPLIVATTNIGKLKEIRATLADLDYDIKSLADLPAPPEIVEDADTFEGNARKKATLIAAKYGIPALSDDSGLEVDALGGAPGVHSARYGGPGLDDKGRYERLLGEMRDVPTEARGCRFKTVMVYASPSVDPKIFHGVMEGTVALSPRGNTGFGYDPIFIPTGMDQTVAELGQEIKNRISHRAKALQAFAAFIREQSILP
jgi:XTP/dITP diphosphohydrolase